jgi:hypothetical protein
MEYMYFNLESGAVQPYQFNGGCQYWAQSYKIKYKHSCCCTDSYISTQKIILNLIASNFFLINLYRNC